MPTHDHAKVFNFRNEVECWGCLSLSYGALFQGWTVGKPKRQEGYDTADLCCTKCVTTARQEQWECSEGNRGNYYAISIDFA